MGRHPAYEGPSGKALGCPTRLLAIDDKSHSAFQRLPAVEGHGGRENRKCDMGSLMFAPLFAFTFAFQSLPPCRRRAALRSLKAPRTTWAGRPPRKKLRPGIFPS